MSTQVSTVSLSDLRERARERADMVDSYFVEDDELNRYIQQSYRKLWNRIISCGDNYIDDPVEFSIASGSNTTDLPATFYKLRGVDFKDKNGKWIPLRNFNFNKRNISTDGGYVRWHPYLRYRLIARKLYIVPTDGANGTYRYWAISKPNVPVDDSDTIDGENGWDEFIVVDAAIKCLSKEESDTRDLLLERQQLEDDIVMSATTLDEAEDDSVQDVRGVDRDYYY